MSLCTGPLHALTRRNRTHSGLGHLAIQFARAMGFYTIALSSGAAKEQLALDLGAHVYIDTSTGRRRTRSRR